jgi:hypothetical protein
VTGVKNVVHNAVYNFGLGDITLHIPDTLTVSAGNYTGNVNWNLAMVPGQEK